MRIIPLAITLALLPVSAAVGQAAADAGQAAPQPEAAKEKKLCRSEPQLGSIMTKRICHSRAEWTAIDRANQDNVDQMRDRTNNGGSARAGGGLN